MEFNATPGPWEVSSLDGRTIGPVGYTHTDPEARQLPQMKAVAVVKERIGETEANARLIAAAPELLAALQSLCDASPVASLIPKEDRKPFIEAYWRANTAIAKALGQS